jgi:hypothetical protein
MSQYLQERAILTLTDAELLDGFEQCTLPNSAFHHEDHIRVAFLYLSRFSVLEALQRFQDGLKRFAAWHGKADLYNETVTWAYILLIRERMARAGLTQDWPSFKASNPDLFDRRPDVLSRYYRPETLSSPLAKSTFLFPDKF